MLSTNNHTMHARLGYMLSLPGQDKNTIALPTILLPILKYPSYLQTLQKTYNMEGSHGFIGPTGKNTTLIVNNTEYMVRDL